MAQVSVFEASGDEILTFHLLVVPDSDVDGRTFEQVSDSLDGRFRVMVREKRLRIYRLCRFGDLFRGHRVRLIAGQERHVDVLQSRHFGNVLRVAGNVDFQPVNGQNVAVIASFGMKLRMPLRRVVGGNGVKLDVFGNLAAFAVFERYA